MPRTVLVLALVGSLGIAADPPAPDVLSKDEQAVLDHTNVERKAAGLPPLRPHPTLTNLAREHSATMARLNQLGHDLDGVTFADRVKASGYEYGGAGENVGKGYARPIDAVAGWMASDGHRKNILSEDFTEVGVAVAASEDGTRYWAQVFGTPRR